ncbi:hypothetical protein [Streptomyces abyssalis]|uniref:hypothetical protein n=1 Tax=Streptomyces abyssalis TaxID=933944 RepID=UPI00085C1561|nr:hypothetical protein [Streptomyces abyssalis]
MSSEKPVGSGGPGPAARPGSVKPPSRLLTLAKWALAFAAAYGLSLLVLTDSLVFLAIPGLIALLALTSTAVLLLLYEPVRGTVPYATDGSDRRGVVRHHRAVLLRRYAMLLCVVAALVALVFATQSDYAVMAAPAAVLAFFVGTGFCGEQMRTVLFAARVLDVYDFTFRAPVEKLNLRSSGKRSLRLGGAGSADERSPELAAHQPLGKLWPKNIEDGVWFAGDEIFGGVVMVPRSGELMRVQPLQWDELGAERSRAGAERIEKAARAGLGRRSL